MTAQGLIDTTEMYLRTVFELEEEGSFRCARGSRSGSPSPARQSARRWPGWNGTACSTWQATGNSRSAIRAGTLATRVMRKHRLAECLLVSVIQLPWEEVHIEACRWEHVISESVERHVFELLGRPDAVRTATSSRALTN